MASVLCPCSHPPPTASSTPLNSLPNLDPPPPSSRSSSPPLRQPSPLTHVPGRWGSSSTAPSSPSPKASNLSDFDFPSILASRPFGSKPGRSTATGAPSARALDVLSASPSPPTFHTSYARYLFRVELPESKVAVGVFCIALDVSSNHSENLDSMDFATGHASPVPSLVGPFPCEPGSSVACGSEAGAMPMPSSSSPCQSLSLPSSGLPGVPIESICNQAPCGDVHSCPGAQLVAPVNSSNSPAPAIPLGAAACPHGVSWSSVVQQNTPGGKSSLKFFPLNVSDVENTILSPPSDVILHGENLWGLLLLATLQALPSISILLIALQEKSGLILSLIMWQETRMDSSFFASHPLICFKNAWPVAPGQLEVAPYFLRSGSLEWFFPRKSTSPFLCGSH